jgi:predicted transcriptional regulator
MKVKSPQETIGKILGKSHDWVSRRLIARNLLKTYEKELFAPARKIEISKLVEVGQTAKAIFPEEPDKQIEFIKTVQELPRKQAREIIKEIKATPDLSIEEAIKKVQEAKPLVLTVEFSPSVAEAISKAAQEKNVSPEQIVRTAVQTWLKSQGYLRPPTETLLVSNNKTAKQQRRTKEEVIADILRACKGGIRQARLLTAANLCHSDLKLYTRQLARDGLLVIKGTPPSYFTTEKGERWLEGYRRWREGRFVL